MNRERTKANKSWRQVVISDFENEGLDYALESYDNYDWVDDQKFQDMIKRFKEARQEIVDYVGWSE